ncbi:hypothetical protein JHK82_016601 [Glycine max]|nr:hypothetical protein JHK82_016601 [Glycine max]
MAKQQHQPQQHEVIEEIVQQIKIILGSKILTLPYDNLVGMESHLAKLSEQLICLGPVNDVRVVGITGMGGIGKSTLGRALYERISHQFNSSCYIYDVSKLYRLEDTLGVQKQLLSQSLNERNLEICNVSDGTLLARKRLPNAKTLIVLDNVDQDKQLDMFTGDRNDLLSKCLGKGSIVIIISRDQQILKAHGVDVIYKVEPLNDNDALRLFDKKSVHKKSVSCLKPSSPIFPCMRQLELSFCNLVEIPDAIGIMSGLERLDLSGNNFASLPNLKKLSKLVCLKLQHCKRLKYLPDLPSRTDQPWEKWSSVKDDEYGLGLNIFNCPELVERDCCTNNCFSWMMQIVQLFTAISFLHHPSGHLKPQWVPFISSIIPGSEMPRWFDEQHLGMGNVINIDRSHFMQLDNWIGIACCVIFVVHKERRMPPPGMEQRKKERPSLYIPVLFREDLVTDESDHLWLFYYPRSDFDVSNFDDLKVESRFRDLYDQDLDVEVKKYAYRWVYEQDFEPSLNTGIGQRKRGTDYEDLIKGSQGYHETKQKTGRQPKKVPNPVANAKHTSEKSESDSLKFDKQNLIDKEDMQLRRDYLMMIITLKN